MKLIGNKQSGFTIVELLVVIVVIGVLAAISLVSYSGISRRAITSSVKTDLASSSQQIKVFYVDQDNYPATISTNCSSQPDSSTNKCLKASPGVTYGYSVNNSSNPKTFSLIATHTSGIKYIISDSTSPELPVDASGGTAATSGGYKTHTFGTSCTQASPCTLTVTTGGSIEITVSGAGGGGAGDSYYCANGPGGVGGFSRITYGSAVFTANGGNGGLACPTNGTGGTVSIVNAPNFANLASPSTGGGSAGGGGGQMWQDADPGGDGGAGGKIVGWIRVTDNQTLSIIVGAGGNAGAGEYADGDPGAAGVVSVRYLN